MPQAKLYQVTQSSCSLGKRGDIVEIEAELTNRQKSWVVEYKEPKAKKFEVATPEKKSK